MNVGALNWWGTISISAPIVVQNTPTAQRIVVRRRPGWAARSASASAARPTASAGDAEVIWDWFDNSVLLDEP
jgi:hypothetical protein